MAGLLAVVQASSVTATIVYFLIILLTYIIWQRRTTSKNLPPGPCGLPLLGYLPFMSKLPQEKFAKLGEKYGKIFSLYMGSRLVVVLGNYEAIKEALVKQGDNFSGRPLFAVFSSVKQEHKGILINEGNPWKEFRRFSLMTLRDFGLGKMNIEPRIKEEVSYYLKAVDKYQGKPTNIGQLIRQSVSNVICSIIFGRRFDYDDPKFQKLITTVAEHVQRIQIAGKIEFLPWLGKIPGISRFFGMKSASVTGHELNDGIQIVMDEHLADYKTGSQNDFIDSWITEGESKSTDDHYIKVEFLLGVLRSLFLAGTDTTATTLRWSLLYLMKYPEIQARVHKEIDDVIGEERTPSLMDRDNMHYTEAVLAEAQRISTILPLSISHSNFEETTLYGYTIPKRTVILPNLWAVHHDSQFFPSPNEFQPERFLDDSGKLKRIEQFIPFSLGKRQCLGEAIAKAELFLYFSSMLQRFEFKKPPGVELCFEYTYAAITLPQEYEVCAVRRRRD